MTTQNQNPTSRHPDAALLPYFMTALIESAEDAIISKNLDGIITSWNAGAERVFGYRADEIVGKSVLTLIPPDRHSEENVIIGKIRAGERVEHYETVRRRKDGNLIDISLTVSPIKDENGNIMGASKIARDVSSIKAAEHRIQASEERYRTLFTSIDEGFCVIQMLFDEHQNPVDYLFVESNPAFERHTGLVNVPGKTARELLPNLEEHWFQIYGKIALTGEPIRFTEGSEAMNRWFDVYAFRVGQPEKHQVALLFNNVTEHKRIENERERLLRELKAEKAKLTYLFTKAPSFVSTLHGPDHIFDMANPAYLQIIGHRDVIGKPVREALPEVAAQGFIELLDRVYQTGEPFIGREMETRLQREPDGELQRCYFDFVYQPIFDDAGAVSGIFAHGVDITEQVQARKSAEEANRAKDEFLATLSHELRTPLNAILGWSRMIGNPVLSDEERTQGLEAIQRNALLQAKLIEDILDVSRIITGKLRLNVQPVELSTVIEAAVESVLPAAQAKEIRLQRVLDSGSDLVSGDLNRLQQVVWNLLSNAIKFTPKGGRVQIRLERVHSHIEIIVTDSGEGVKPEILPYIFDRFRQADSAITRTHGGLGLGLAIVRHIVEMHGGTVEVESTGVGQGATFTVKLPLIATRSAQKEKPDSERRVHPTVSQRRDLDCPPELEGLHVLVVDDEDDSRRLVQTVLERCSAQVTVASSVAEAMELFTKKRPDVVVSDLGMPGEDGYSLIKKLRALSPEQGGLTPVAALTAYARVEDRMKVLRAGFQIHLPKPVEPAELVAVVANLAGRHGQS